MSFSHRPPESDGNNAVNRRMFRSITADIKRSPRGNGNGNGNYRQQQRTAPPESTNAENFYYLKQMNAKTPMVIIMTDGEEIRGWIEWYDRNCLKINRGDKPNLLIQKQCIKYMFKQDEL
jgi:sRNA-binding regulator protein Hfq